MNAVLPRSPFEYPPFPIFSIPKKTQLNPFYNRELYPLFSFVTSGSTPDNTADSTPPPIVKPSCISVVAPESHVVSSSKPAYKEKTLPKTPSERLTPFTPQWILRRLQQDPPEDSKATLRHWLPFRRRAEFSDDLVQQIKDLPEEQALSALRELRKPKQFVKGRGGQQLLISAQVTTTATNQIIGVRALVDSGCVGSCVDRDFVERHKLPIEKTAIPIPVYNADGTINKDGSIRGFVTLRLKIKDHAELVRLAVTKIETAEIFLGHDWLKDHNPSINWTDNTLVFDRCPKSCGYLEKLLGPDFDDESVSLEEGDRLLMVTFDLEKELQNRAIVPNEGPDFIAEFPDVFSAQEFDQLPEHRPWDHAIDLTEGFVPSNCKIYPLSADEQEELAKFLDENLRTGRIRPSKSPMASSFFFIKKGERKAGDKKKKAELRPVQDYRKLNSGTIPNKYPLPLIQELLDKTQHSRFFTKLDVRWGYNNIRIKEGDEWKAAFRTNRGLFEPTVMFFGLTNSPATFQSFMNHIFKDLIDDGHVVVYLDDILIFAETREHHDRLVRQVLQVLRDNKLFLKPEKCSFGQTTLSYLGNIIGNGEIRMSPNKVTAVSEWPVPQNKSQLQSFLGFCNYYRRFIRNFSGIARPLHVLTGNVDWTWSDKEQEAFEKLKTSICSEPVIAVYVQGAPIRVEVDSSDFANGGILSQEIDGVWRPIAFRSQSLSPTQQNYEIYDKELLAIVEALREWRHYLVGNHFEIWTDHQNLTYFREAQKINRRQARWYTELQDFDFTLVHKKGKQMGKADLLSRRADLDGGEKHNENVTVLKSEWFNRVIAIETLDSDFVQRIKQSLNNKDQSVVKALNDKDPSWREEDGLLLCQERLYVPRNKKLKEDIIRAHHDSAVAGHPGQKSTRELITRNYYWPQITADVNRYVAGCEKCQRTKPKRHMPKAPLNPHDAPPYPWHTVSGDMIGELPESSGYNAIAVFVDRFSKQIHVIPSNTNCTALGMATLFRDHVFKLHGKPRKFISDRGSQYKSLFSDEFYRLSGIEANPSTAYHPQTDGQTERINQEIEQYLRLFINYHQSDWADWLALAEFSYNDKRQASTGFSPFYVNSGRHPYKGTEPNFEESTVPGAAEFVKKMEDIHKETKAALELTAETMKKYYDKKRQPSHQYKVGDKVYLEGLNLTIARPMTKLSDKRYGPFRIVKKVGASAYKLALPQRWSRVHNVFNEHLLTPFQPPSYPSQKARQPDEPPDLEDPDKAEYDVEAILEAKVKRGKLHYLVKWLGYSDEHNSWEPGGELLNAAPQLREFYRKNPGAPRPIDSVAKQLRLQKITYVTEFEKPPPRRDW